MIRWLTDTLARRLFLLMWGALVASHLLAFAVVHALNAPPPPRSGGEASSPGRLPTFPSLPPTPGLPGEPDAGRPPGGPQGGPPGGARGTPPSLPTAALLLDYAVRLVVIAAAAFFGSRWLAAPMRRLVAASASLDGAVARSDALPALDERAGTHEVREAARVFNRMAARLREQFRARGLMIAAISHDLRTPLTRLRIRLRIRLESMDAEPGQQQRCIADIREMNTLIDGVLDIFRSGAAAEPPQPTDVAALVQALADDLAEQGRAVRFQGEGAIAMARPAALRRVVGNLLDNALRYGSAARVTVQADAAGVHVVVEDDGPGIAPQHMEAVFQPFFRADASLHRKAGEAGGTGLGLYIARDLTEAQGGRLTLANRPEGGLRAELLLPHHRMQPA